MSRSRDATSRSSHMIRFIPTRSLCSEWFAWHAIPTRHSLGCNRRTIIVRIRMVRVNHGKPTVYARSSISGKRGPALHPCRACSRPTSDFISAVECSLLLDVIGTTGAVRADHLESILLEERFPEDWHPRLTSQSASEALSRWYQCWTGLRKSTATPDSLESLMAPPAQT